MSGLERALRDHDDEVGWIEDDADLLRYRCACGTESQPFARSAEGITDREVDMAADWHYAHVAAAVESWLAERLASDEVREAVAEALSCSPGNGEFMPYMETAVEDHNRWSWRGDGHDPEDGTPSVMREAYRQDATAALTAITAALTQGDRR